MKVTLLIAALLLSACASKTEIVGNKNSSSPSSPAAAKPENTGGTSPANTDLAPVEFTSLGITTDKANVSFRIKVNTDKPIDEVHLALKETDGKGKVVENTTIVWQNVVGSSRKPIERGNTYEDQTGIDASAAKADVSLKEVIFKDGSKWAPK